MTKRDQSVKTYSGTPPAGAFGATQGTPIVIDYAAAIGYFMHPITSVVTPLGGGGGGGVTSVTGVTPISSTGGTTPAIAIVGLTTFGTALQVIRTNAALTACEWADPGLLVNWTESIDTAAPNVTVPAVRFIAKNAGYSNIDAVLSPKGTGALLANSSNSLISGGGKRGIAATDFQLSRLATAQIASGNSALLIGCVNSTASGLSSAVTGGDSNQATFPYTICAGGLNAVASNSFAITLAGNGVTASGQSAGAGGSGSVASGDQAWAFGSFTVASGQYSVATGFDSTTRGLFAARAHGSGRHANLGDTQEIGMILRGNTVDATPKVLTGNNSTLSATNQLALIPFSTLLVTGKVVASTAAMVSKHWTFSCGIIKTSNNASTAMVAACTPVVVAQDAGATAWTLTVTADTTLGVLALTFTGAAATLCRIGATITAMELTF